MAWLAKGFGGPPLTILHVFYRQSVLIALQKVEDAFILKCIIVVGEAPSRLITLSSFPSPFFYVLLLIGRGFGT
jgi:hypothetical protein